MNSEEIEGQEVKDQDGFLQALVNMVNKGELDIGITLTVKGLIVSGQLISRDSYMTKFWETMAQGFARGGRKDIADAVRQAFVSAKEPEEEPQVDDKAPLYIHLDDVRFYPSSQQVPSPSSPSGLWRGKLSSIDGFLVGNLTD